jgi:hypothetical protein
MDYQDLKGKDFEFLIKGDIDVFDYWDDIMTPNSFEYSEFVRNKWPYYKVGNDEFSYSVEPPGIQMTFNDEITFSKAKAIADEIIFNINQAGQNAELIIIDKNRIYGF